LEMWTQREPAWRQDGPAAFAVWLAMRRSGLLAEADRVWDALQAQHGTGLNLGNRKVALGELRTQFGSDNALAGREQAAWWLYGGNAARSAIRPKPPALESALWQLDTFQTSAARVFLESAVRAQEARPQPVLAGAFPIVVGDKVIFRGA